MSFMELRKLKKDLADANEEISVLKKDYEDFRQRYFDLQKTCEIKADLLSKLIESLARTVRLT